MTAIAIDPPPTTRPARWIDALGLAVALIGHVVVFALLSASFLAKPDMVQIKEQPIDVTLADKVGLEATAPQSVTPPAQSVAPDVGAPEDAAPPPPSTPAPNPTPSAAKPAPAPDAKPAERARPTPTRPAPQTPQRPARTHASEATLPDPATFLKPATGRDRAATKPHPRGATLGDDFLKGLDSKPTKSQSQTPHAAVIDAQALMSLQDAISRQIKPCADRQAITAMPESAKKIIIVFNVKLLPDGSLDRDPIISRQDNVDEDNSRYARSIADVGLAAFKRCSPLVLPQDLYRTADGRGWNNFIYKWQLR